MTDFDFSDFDSEVLALISDLSLVLKLSPEGRAWWSRWLASRHHTPLCERYKAYIEMKQRDNARLLHGLARRNAKYSRFSYDPDDFVLQGKLDL